MQWTILELWKEIIRVTVRDLQKFETKSVCTMSLGVCMESLECLLETRKINFVELIIDAWFGLHHFEKGDSTIVTLLLLYYTYYTNTGRDLLPKKAPRFRHANTFFHSYIHYKLYICCLFVDKMHHYLCPIGETLPWFLLFLIKSKCIKLVHSPLMRKNSNNGY